MELWALRVSALALVVSAASMFISWRTYRRDQSRIQMRLYYHPESGSGTSFRLRVVNSGRRACSVERAEVLFRSGASLVEAFAQPRTLSEAEPLDIWFPLFDKPLSADVPVGLTGARLTDTVGKTYVIPRKLPADMLRFHQLRKSVIEQWHAYTDQ